MMPRASVPTPFRSPEPAFRGQSIRERIGNELKRVSRLRSISRKYSRDRRSRPLSSGIAWPGIPVRLDCSCENTCPCQLLFSNAGLGAARGRRAHCIRIRGRNPGPGAPAARLPALAALGRAKGRTPVRPEPCPRPFSGPVDRVKIKWRRWAQNVAKQRLQSATR